ncbi:O-antigen ligase family protein [Candidatus Omnitrophota bacterium]
MIRGSLKKIKANDVIEKALVLSLALLIVIIPYSKKVVKPYFCAGLFLWLLLNILRHGKGFYRHLIIKNPINKPLVVFFGVSIIATIFSLDPHHSQGILFERFLPYFILFWISAGLVVKPDRKDISRFILAKDNLYILIGAFMLSGLIFGLGGFWDYITLFPKRLFTVFGKKISYSMFPIYLVYFTPFNLIFFVFSKHRLKRLALLNVTLLFPCFIWSVSRSAWIAIVTSTSLLLLSFKKARKIFLVAMLISIGLFLAATPYTQNRALSAFDPHEWAYRPKLFQAAVNIFINYPLFGAGLGMYEKLFPIFKPPFDYPLGFERLHAHNTYLEILSEMSVWGLAAFIWIFVSFFTSLLKVLRQHRESDSAVLLSLASTVAAVLILAFVSSLITIGTQAAPLFWILFGIASALTLNPDAS